MIKFGDPCSESKGQLKNHETGSASEIQDGRRRHLECTFSAAISLFLSDLHQILQTDTFNAAAHYNNTKSEVEFEIQDGGGGHIGFLRNAITQSNINRC